jgi:hypothetical protein
MLIFYACVEKMAWLGLLCMALGLWKTCKMLGSVDTVGEKMSLPHHMVSTREIASGILVIL